MYHIPCIDWFCSTPPCTGWRRLIGCLMLQVMFRKRATNHRALLRKMTYEDKASYDSTPPCIKRALERKASRLERGVSHIDESCHAYEWGMSHVEYQACIQRGGHRDPSTSRGESHTRMRHVKHTEASHPYRGKLHTQRQVTHTEASHTYERGMSHISLTEASHTYEWGMPHIWAKHEARHMYKRGIWMGCVTHTVSSVHSKRRASRWHGWSKSRLVGSLKI